MICKKLNKMDRKLKIFQLEIKAIKSLKDPINSKK